MNKFLSILFLSLFLFNCTSNTIIKKPDNLIPKDQMVDLLTDILIASEAKNIKNIDQKRNVNYYPFIYEKYHIDSTRFYESNIYYTSRIDDYKDLFEKVNERLNTIKLETDNEIKVRDSIHLLEKKEKRERKLKKDTIK